MDNSREAKVAIMKNFEHDKPRLILKEYGRNVQKLVEYVCSIKDIENRTKSAYALIDLMKQINPAIKDSPETAQKLWDDLYIMSGFTLEVDSPFPMPEKSLLGKKPKRLEYNVHDIRYKHYGRNIELLIEKATAIDDEEDKESAIIYIGKLMKGFYSAWNKENIDDSVIVENIKEMSKKKLEISLDKVRENNLFDVQRESRDRDRDRDSRGDRDKDRNRTNNIRPKKSPGTNGKKRKG